MGTMHRQKLDRPHRRLTVTTPASATSLTSADRVKQSLAITDTSRDALIAELIVRVTQEIVGFLRIPEADDGSAATLGRETYVETVKYLYGPFRFFLSRRPISSVASVIEDGETLVLDTDYQINKRLGALERLDGDDVVAWSADKVVATYDAGYLLPDDGSRNLPYDIEEATIYAIKFHMLSLPEESGAVKREKKSITLPGVYSATYESSGAFVASDGGFLPDRSKALLARHRMPMI